MLKLFCIGNRSAEARLVKNIYWILLLAGFLYACGKDETRDEKSIDSETLNYFVLSYDGYGLMIPNYYYSTNNEAFFSIQADVANNVHDPNYKCIIRIDIQKETGVEPEINKLFCIEDNPQCEKFPGQFLIFNGQPSTYKKVVSGNIAFDPDSTMSSQVSGSFDVVFVDYDSALTPAPQYNIKGSFGFKIGTHGPL